MTRTNQRRHAVTAGVALLALSAGACSSGKSADTAGSSSSASQSSTSHSSTTSSTHRSSSPTTSAPSSTPPKKPATDPLTGGKQNGKPVIAVKLENTAAAMPQQGLSAADLVFVEEVEGNLTRLMPVYQSSYPSRVEPVRSARTTDIDILPMFGKPLLVYSGVASQVRPKLTKASIRLNSNGARDSGRVAPHNVYFNLAKAAKATGLSTAKDIGLRFAAKDPLVKNAPAQPKVAVRVGGDDFTFSYAAGRYRPSWNGRPYTDGGKPVTAANVLVVKTKSVPDSYKDPAGNPVYKSLSTGSGKLALYRNGKKLKGNWQRSAPNKPFRLRAADGKQLHLAPGKTWILLQA